LTKQTKRKDNGGDNTPVGPLTGKAAQKAPESDIRTIPIEDIIASTDVQARAKVSRKTIEEYTEAMAEGATFPPIEAVEGPDGLLVWDGTAGGSEALQDQDAAVPGPARRQA
jgi:hypothetical protein